MDLDFRLSVRGLYASIASVYVKKNAIYVVDTLQGAMPASRVRKGGCLKSFRHVLSRSHACRSHLLGTGRVHTTHFRRLDNIRGVFKTPLCHAPLNVSIVRDTASVWPQELV